MAITIKFLADVANWLDGLSDSSRALDDQEQSLEDVMKKAIELGRAVGKSTDDIASDFSKAFGIPLDRAKSAVEEVVSQTEKIGDASGDAGTKVSSDLGGAAEIVGGKLSELGGIARDVLSGDFGSAAESAIGSLGGIAAFAGAGGALAGGLATAVGGLVGTWISEWQRADEEAKKSASEWAQAYIEAGSTVLDSSTRVAKALAIATDPEQFATASENAKNWGVDVSVAMAAMSGESWALKAAQDNLAESANKLKDEQKEVGIQYPEIAEDLVGYTNRVFDGQNALDGLTGAMSAGRDQASAYSEYLTLMARNTEGATTAVDEFGDSVITLPDGKQVYIDAETGQATMDMDAIEAKSFQPKTVPVKVTVDDSAWRAFRPAPKAGTIYVGDIRTTGQIAQLG